MTSVSGTRSEEAPSTVRIPRPLRIGSLFLTLLLLTAWVVDEWRVDRFESDSERSGSRYAWKLGGARVESLSPTCPDGGSDAPLIPYRSVADEYAEDDARWREEMDVEARTSLPSLERARAPWVETARAAMLVRVGLVLTLVWLALGWLPLRGPPVSTVPFTAVNVLIHLLLLAGTCWFVFGGVLANTGGASGLSNLGLSPVLVLLAFSSSVAMFVMGRSVRAKARRASDA